MKKTFKLIKQIFVFINYICYNRYIERERENKTMTKDVYLNLINYLENRINFNEMSTDARIYYNDIVAILEDDYNIKSLTDEKINSFVREFIDDEELI